MNLLRLRRLLLESGAIAFLAGAGLTGYLIYTLEEICK